MDNFWFGTDTSFKTYLDKLARLDNPDLVAHMRGMWETSNQSSNTVTEDDEELEDHWLLERQGTTGIIHVSGELTNEKAWYNEWVGLVSYTEIIEALDIAATDESLKQIVMLYHTGGGTASGIRDAGEHIKFIDKDFKPVYAYTKTAAFSAGYWLASSARSIMVEEMGQVGSIGAIATHISYKGMLDGQGIVATVFREGEFKALGQPYEELDDKAKEHFQERLKETNAFFLDAVMTNRSLSMSQQSEWGEGKTFYGRKAVNVGLADEVISLRGLMSRFVETSSGNGRTYFGTSDGESSMTVKDNAKPATAKPGEAKLEVPAVPTPENGSKTNLDEAETALLAAAQELTSTEEQPEAQAAAPIPTAPAQENPELAALKEKITQLEGQLADAQELETSLKDVVVQYASFKTKALGGTPVDLSTLPTEIVLSHYHKVDEQFNNQYKRGQQSAAPNLSTAGEKATQAAPASPGYMHEAYLQKRNQTKV